MKSGFFTTVLRHRTAVFAGLAMATAMTTAHATNLVINGGFEATTKGTGQLGFNTEVTGWSVPNPVGGGSYAFVFSPGEADTTGVKGQNGNLQLRRTKKQRGTICAVHAADSIGEKRRPCDRKLETWAPRGRRRWT